MADFVVVMHPNNMKEKFQKNHYVELSKTIEAKGKKRTLKILAPVISSNDKLIDKYPKNGKPLTENQIGVDQTYREAIGIKEHDQITINCKNNKKIDFTEILLGKMGFQKSIVRIQPNATYMERHIPVVCLCEEMITSINAVYGDQIVIESDKKKIPATCAPLAPLMEKFHDYVSNPPADKEKKEGLQKETKGYFVDPTEWGLTSQVLQDRGDLIHPIFIDELGRKLLGVRVDDSLYPVKIRRSFRWEFLKKLNSFGSISLIALSITLGLAVMEPEKLFYWFWSAILGAWGAWSVLTSSTYKTSVS